MRQPNTNRHMMGPCCPWCEIQLDAEHCIVGVPWIQIEGTTCHLCLSYEIGPYLVGGLISEVEMATLWTGPIEDHPHYSPFNPEWDFSKSIFDWEGP